MSGKKYLFANWKMYLDFVQSQDLASALAERVSEFDDHVAMTVFPSALAVASAADIFDGTSVAVGAQNVHWVEKGGSTGEISAPMFKAVGCQYALVGHSERRHLFHETNHEVRQKIEAILAAGMTPVLCVGETESEKRQDKTAEVIEVQLRSALQDISWPEGHELIIAYEPVWAIGTGEACDPIDVERVHELIKKEAEALVNITPIMLYGGSVRPENVAEYLKNPNINGVLVGGASTQLESWWKIVKAV